MVTSEICSTSQAVNQCQPIAIAVTQQRAPQSFYQSHPAVYTHPCGSGLKPASVITVL